MADNNAAELLEIAIYRDVEIAECCIHKVPGNLRKVNPEAYSPQLISIGPYHHGKQVLAAMENHKIRYVNAFFSRLTRNQLEELNNFVVINERRIRNQYAEPCQFSRVDFLKMVLVDAIFIIQLFLRVLFEHQGDFLLNEVWLGTIRRDLLLLENQLPYFVLEGLYNLARQNFSGNQISFTSLAGGFFQLNRSHNRPLSSQRQDVTINHFTDLYRFSLVEIPETPRFGSPVTSEDTLPNVVKLKKSGVKFKPRWGRFLVEVKLNEPKIPLFNGVELEIPCFEITENTECLIRNLMALEHCHYPSETYICSYIHLLTFLIKTEKDVDLLVEDGIILNFVGSNVEIAKMFNELCRQIPQRDSYYFGISYSLKQHYQSRWNHAKATCKLIYVKMAAAVVLFTLIQTIFSVLQVVLHK